MTRDEIDSMKRFQRRMNGVSNIIFCLAFIAATAIGIVAIAQNDWQWSAKGFAFCGIAMAWSFIFYVISKAPVHTSD